MYLLDKLEEYIYMTSRQKTILLPIYHGMRAKNFFYTDIYRVLAEDHSLRLVIAVPPYKLAYYKNIFREPTVIFEPLDLTPNDEPFLGKILAEFAFNLLNTKTIREKQQLQYMQYGNYPRFCLKRAISVVLGPITPLRRVVRFLDYLVPLDQGILEIIDRYKPVLILSPDNVFPVDRFFLRAARKCHIKTIGLLRSWDNLTSKGVIQILPDTLILQTHWLKKQAIELADMKPENIIVAGAPDFDDYFKPMKRTREEFFERLGIPLSHRVVLFTPFYDKHTGAGVAILNAMVKAIQEKRLPDNLHILLRYRPGLQKDIRRKLLPNPNLTVTEPCQKYFYTKDKGKEKILDWEFSQDEVDLLTHSIYYSDAVVTTVSTLTIDAAAADRPAIAIRFDPVPCLPFHQVNNVAVLQDHFRDVEKTGGVRLVYSMDQYIAALREYLLYPERDREGRRRIREEQLELCDGKSGRRAAEYIKAICLLTYR